MKKRILTEGRKRLIDSYIDQRCRDLQEQSKWNPANWDWSYDNINKRLNQAGNIPIVGKLPGLAGGVMDMAKGAYEGDWGRVASGATGALFSGTGGSSVVKNLTKQGVKKYTGKQLANDASKDIVKSTIKNPIKTNVKNQASNTVNQLTNPTMNTYDAPTQTNTTPNVNYNNYNWGNYQQNVT